MPKYSQNPKKKLHKKAWDIFSKYIRFIRDKGVCYTCGVKKDPKEMDAGHYKHCDCLDFDEMNIHCQCSNCNRNLRGNSKSYERRLISEYGEGEVEHLKIRAKKIKQYEDDELQLIIDTYKEKLDAM
jgi:hypothetical protein